MMNRSDVNSRRSPRSAFTLIEMLVIMPVLTTLLFLSIAWMHKTMQFTSAAKAQRQYHQKMTRLAWDFRDDINGCQKVSPLADGVSIEFGNGVIKNYVIADNEIRSTSLQSDKRIANERYTLHPDAMIIIQSPKDSDEPEWVTLQVRSAKQQVYRSSGPEGDSSAESLGKLELMVECKVNRWEVGR